MASFKILTAFGLLAAVVSLSLATPPVSELPRPSYARTMLKVSRSLPGETEELKVRTSEGNLATLIVKRREKSVSNLSPSNEFATTSTTTTTDASSKVVGNDSFPTTTTTTTTTSTTTSAPTTSATIGYQNVEVDPWNRVQTWSSVSSSNDNRRQEEQQQQQQQREEQESRNWVPVNRGFDSWKPVEPYSTIEPTRFSWLVADQIDRETSRGFQTIPADNESGERIIRYAFLPHEPRRNVRTNIGANLMKNRDAKNVPPEVVVRSEINVKPQPGQSSQIQSKRLPMSLDADGTPVVHGRRVPDEPIDKIQVWRNARVINDQLVTDASTSSTTARGLSEASGQSFERFFEDVNRRYTKIPDDATVRPKTYRNEILAAEIYETAEDTYRPSIRKRMLQPEISAVYPNSRVYSPPEPQKVKPGTRAPVLQYAHPELGVQPAKIVKNERTKRLDEIESNSMQQIQQQVQQQYGYQPQTQQQQQQQTQYYGENRHKKKYVLNNKISIDRSNQQDYYPTIDYYPTGHFYGLKRPETPFWMKLGDEIKSQIHVGVHKVSDLLKPVSDPLVEATRKISENLGLSSSRSQNGVAQDKIGTVATGSSVLFPALGLVASGAALGIGAVAVGRYLDVDVLKRSNSEGLVPENNEERAMKVLEQLQDQGVLDEVQQVREAGANGNVYVVMQDKPQGMSRRKRSSGNDDAGSRQMQRKGADEIAEIVEIDVPSRSLEVATNEEGNEEGNEVHIENEEAFAQQIVQQAIEAIAGSAKAENLQPEESTRRRRSLNEDEELDDVLQNLENAEIAEAEHIPGDWTNTPCAKRIFCDAMVKRGNDAAILMDKKMSGLLRMIQPSAAVQVSSHFDEVMDAVRRHDCSVFACLQARPASVFL